MVTFEEAVLYGFLTKGKLRLAMEYLTQFPEKRAEIQWYQRLFEQEQYIVYDVEPELNQLLYIFQQYYRDAFYLNMPEQSASERMQKRFEQHFLTKGQSDAKEWEARIQSVFEKYGYHYLGGRTSGYFGPYIWKTTTQKTYLVELPEGIQTYRVNLLSDFLMNSWLDYISNGRISTGGWADEDGVLNCVESSYDLTSEAFKVSLLKHEAQHILDLSRNPGATSVQLEYRAKLVELIYSAERNLLPSFAGEADLSNPENAHGIAAEQIITSFREHLGDDTVPLANLPVSQIQQIARKLFAQSTIS